MMTWKRRCRCCVLVLLGSFLIAEGAWASVVTRRLGTGLSASGLDKPLPEAWVAPVEAAPRIDGRLTDKAWSVTEPVLLGKLLGRGKTSPRTEVRLVHHKDILYVAARLDEPDVGRLKRTVTKPDGPAYQDDSVELFLSPDPAGGYFQIIVTAGGAIYDRHGHGDPKAWNCGAKAAAAIGKDHWSLEVAIPMAALGVGEKKPTRWRANVYRNRRAGGKSESQAFSPTFRGDYDVPERFGRWLFTPTSPWAEVKQTAGKQRGITVEELDDGTAVLLFDLSAIPQGAKVHRANLRCQREPMDGLNDDALVPIEIFPLVGPYKKGSRPSVAGRPLPLVAPWYDAFEMTEVMRGWVAKKRNGGVWVKRCPGWRKHRTYLDVMYEGNPENVPPSATGVKALHRAGQTFLTWKEIDDPVGRDAITWGEMKSLLTDLDRGRQTRYCIYRSNRPITTETLPAAERIAEVKPLSCWNLNGRNIDRPIDRFIAREKVLRWHQWNPFQNASIDGDYGRDCPIDRFVIADGEQPLSRGAGVYVHTPAKKEKGYYAIVTSIDGVENTRDLRVGRNVTGPIVESVAEAQPVLQGELPRGPFFNYDQRRLHYVRWVVPPYTNRPYDYHNWSVGVPNDLEPDAALELNLHRDGHSYWRTHYRIEPGSVVICPYDFPLVTNWYGYHEALGTLRCFKVGAVHNYTEKRLLWFLDWAAAKWRCDRNRILVTGCQGGASGSGALHMGLRYADVFNLIVAGHGEPNYTATDEQAQRIWGKPAWGLKTEDGKTVWDELDLLRAVKALPAGAELPFLSMTYSNQQERTHSLAEALMAGRHAVITHTAWGGQRMIPVSATATNWCVPLDIRKNRSMLAVHCRGKTGDAVRNGSLLWETADLVDRPDEYAVTLRQGRGEFDGRITVRRLQQFKVQPGRRYAWKLEPLQVAAPGARDAPATQEGAVTIAADGLLTLDNLKLKTGKYRLTIKPK